MTEIIDSFCADSTCDNSVISGGNDSRLEHLRKVFCRSGFQSTLYKAIPCIGIRHIIKNEDYVFDTNSIVLVGKEDIIGSVVDWSLGVYNIDVNSVVVASTSGNIYDPLIDYNIDDSTGTITRSTSGHIGQNEAVKIDYNWYESCVQIDTGRADPYCPNCHGTGQSYDGGMIIRATRGIPKYNNPYEKLGYWEIGDDVFNVFGNVDVMAASVGPDGLFLRDKFIVDNEEWFVMSRPEIIQFRGQYLFKQCHVRNINKVNKTNKRRGNFNSGLEGATVNGTIGIDQQIN